MRSFVTAGVKAAILDRPLWDFRTFVRRPAKRDINNVLVDQPWVNISATAGGDWVTRIHVGSETPDQPVGEFEVSLIHSADGDSLAPGIQSTLNTNAASEYDPIVYPGSEIYIEARYNGGVWREWLRGEIDQVNWPGNDVVCSCTTLDSLIEQTYIEAEGEEFGSPDPGTPIETVIQSLLDRWYPGVTLLVEGAPGAGISKYSPDRGSLGAHIREMVQKIGWDIRYKWHEASLAFRYTLYLPDRDKADPNQDLVLDDSHLDASDSLDVKREWVRNAFLLSYLDPTTGERIERTRENIASIDKYNRRFMAMIEDEKSNIKSISQADALLAFADKDLADVHSSRQIRIPFFPWIEIRDLITVPADGRQFDFAGDWSVVDVSHEVSSEGAYTTLSIRSGSPQGMYFGWHALPSSVRQSTSMGLNVSTTFNELNETLLTVNAPLESQQTYVKVGEGFEPVDPTALDNDGGFTGRRGEINTGVVITPGNLAYIKVKVDDNDSVLFLVANTEDGAITVTVRFNDLNEAIVSANGPQTLDEMFVTVGLDADPANPANTDSRIAGYNGSVNTTTVIPPAHAAHVKIAGARGGVLGRVYSYVFSNHSEAGNFIRTSHRWVPNSNGLELHVDYNIGTDVTQLQIRYNMPTPAVDYTVGVDPLVSTDGTIVIEDGATNIKFWQAGDAAPSIRITPKDAAGAAGEFSNVKPEAPAVTGLVGARAQNKTGVLAIAAQGEMMIFDDDTGIVVEADASGRPRIKISSISPAQGGTGLGGPAPGDIIYGSTTLGSYAHLPAGTAGYALIMGTDVPAWGKYAYSNLSGIPASFAPSAHAASHASAGSDPLSVTSLGDIPLQQGYGGTGRTTSIGTGSILYGGAAGAPLEELAAGAGGGVLATGNAPSWTKNLKGFDLAYYNAGGAAAPAPTPGALWFDSSTSKMKVGAPDTGTGSSWTPVQADVNLANLTPLDGGGIKMDALHYDGTDPVAISVDNTVVAMLDGAAFTGNVSISNPGDSIYLTSGVASTSALRSWRARFGSHNDSVTDITYNARWNGTNWDQDDTAKASYLHRIDSVSGFLWYRAVATTGEPGFSTQMQLDAAGNLKVWGNVTADRAFTAGLSTSWGTTNGLSTGGINVAMGTSTSATWLISGTSGGVFRSGIQALDGGGSARWYVGTNYLALSSGGVDFDGTEVSLAGHKHSLADITSGMGTGGVIVSPNGSSLGVLEGSADGQVLTWSVVAGVSTWEARAAPGSNFKDTPGTGKIGHFYQATGESAGQHGWSGWELPGPPAEPGLYLMSGSTTNATWANLDTTYARKDGATFTGGVGISTSSGTFSVTQTADAATDYHVELHKPMGTANHPIRLRFHQGGRWYHKIEARNTGFHFMDGAGAGTAYRDLYVSNIYSGANTFWHAGNDGSGSGLDADLLDGVQGANYARTDKAETFTGSGDSAQLTLGPNTAYGKYLTLGGWGTATTNAWVRTSNGNLHMDGGATSQGMYLNHYGTGNIHVGNGGGYVQVYNGLQIGTSHAFRAENTTWLYLRTGPTSTVYSNLAVGDLHVDGNMALNGYARDNSSEPYMGWNLGKYNTETTVTGALVIHTNLSYTSPMFWVKIRGYTYGHSQGPFEIDIGAYSNGTNWYSYGHTNTGNHRPTVRLALDAANKVIIILGDVASTWSYSKITVAEAGNGYGSNYLGSWSIALETDLTPYTRISPNLPDRTRAAYADNAGKLDGYNSSQSNAANSVAVRDTNGDVQARLFRPEYTGTTSTTPYIMVQHAVGTGDNYIRPALIGTIKNNMGLQNVDGTTLSGHWSSSSHFTAGGELYAGNWMRLANAGGRTGIYWQNGPAQGWHIYHRNATVGTPAKYYDLMIRSGTTANSSIMLTLGDETPRGYIHWTSTNDIGFLSNSRGWTLRVNSSSQVYAGSYYTTSERRLKHSIRPFDEDPLEKLSGVDIVHFHRKADEQPWEHTGIIADDSPTWLTGPEGKVFDAAALAAVNTAAIQALAPRVETSEQKIVRLERRVAELEARHGN